MGLNHNNNLAKIAASGPGNIPLGGGFNGEYDDMLGAALATVGSGTLSIQEYRNTGFNLQHYKRNAAADKLPIIYQFSHQYWPGTNVHVHLHAIPLATWVGAPASKNAYFELKYYWCKIGFELPVVASWTVTNVTWVINKTDQFMHIYWDFADVIVPAGANGSDHLFVQLTRLGTNVLDTYQDDGSGVDKNLNIAVLYMDVHYQKSRAGTINETPPP